MTDNGERLGDEISRLAYLRTVQDWIIRPQLRGVPGVADIDSLGGYEKQYVVEPDATKLSAYEISYAELARALEAANVSVGANHIQRAGESTWFARMRAFAPWMTSNARSSAPARASRSPSRTSPGFGSAESFAPERRARTATKS